MSGVGDRVRVRDKNTAVQAVFLHTINNGCKLFSGYMAVI